MAELEKQVQAAFNHNDPNDPNDLQFDAMPQNSGTLSNTSELKNTPDFLPNKSHLDVSKPADSGQSAIIDGKELAGTTRNASLSKGSENSGLASSGQESNVAAPVRKKPKSKKYSKTEAQQCILEILKYREGLENLLLHHETRKFRWVNDRCNIAYYKMWNRGSAAAFRKMILLDWRIQRIKKLAKL